MSGNPFVSDQVAHYLTEVISRETPVQRRLREETAKLPMSRMLTTPDEAAFLALLVKLINAGRIIEIGTFTGYSALAMAAALPEGGRLVALDISKEWTDIARRYWKEAGVDARIDLRLAPAKESLARLEREEGAGSFDMAFIDADKVGYDAYYEACLTLLRPGGLVAFDNMLWGGAVADEAEQAADTKALRALNAKIRDDKRVDCALASIADGVMLARKR